MSNVTTLKKGQVQVICYGQRETWRSRQEAKKFYFEAMVCCEGSERDRYTNIYIDLEDGKTLCSDGDGEWRDPDPELKTYK